MSSYQYAVIAEAKDASEAVLAHSTLWLSLHPIKHRRLRRRLIAARKELDAVRVALAGDTE